MVTAIDEPIMISGTGLQVRGSVGASSKLASLAAKGSKASKGSQGPPVRQVIMKAAAKAEAKGGKSSPAGKGKGEAKVVASPYKAKGQGTANDGAAKGAAKGSAAKGAATKGTAAKGTAAKGPAKGPAKGDSKDKERTVVAKIPRLGTISKWLGKYGHPSAILSSNSNPALGMQS